MRLRAEDQSHQFVISGMKFDKVDVVAETVVGLEFRKMPVGLPRQLLHLVAADDRTGPRQVIARPVGAEHRRPLRPALYRWGRRCSRRASPAG